MMVLGDFPWPSRNSQMPAKLARPGPRTKAAAAVQQHSGSCGALPPALWGAPSPHYIHQGSPDPGLGSSTLLGDSRPDKLCCAVAERLVLGPVF